MSISSLDLVASLSPISVIRGKVNEERQTGSKNSKNEGNDVPKKEAEMNTFREGNGTVRIDPVPYQSR